MTLCPSSHDGVLAVEALEQNPQIRGPAEMLLFSFLLLACSVQKDR